MTIAHGWKMIKTRLWFCLPFVIGGTFEVIGYTARATASNSTGSLAPYLIQAIFLLLPPVLFAATLYMVYSRVVRAVQGERFSLLSPRWTTAIFIFSDFQSLSIQSNGAGLLDRPRTVHIGDYIIIAGLAIQIVMFAGFMLCCLTFNHRLRVHIAETGSASGIPWQPCLKMLYAASLAILARNIYRVIEFITGQNGYLLDHEWPTYVFDGALMLLVMIGFLIWHPSKLSFTARDSVIELTSDRRSIVEHDDAAKRPEHT
ncbi:MAG: hypothetical protein M1821_008914 [Bathelium mastoideum]|nr:MAG: hypothetical protein M1821_008914 [Bathelium mastoideum]